MGVSALEYIYLPNLLCARGIKPTKSQKSEENWVFKLARSTYTQAGEILLRTTLGITANDAWYHRERRLVSPRTTPGITADDAGYYWSPWISTQNNSPSS